ncbi:mobile mystery protein B [Aquirufa ecclesiirivi]|uniref:Mobile mystery protein B n=1 Tax=Aquirufa ecclesiirivi TaxID=2715124 RepID=A0ABT4JIF9_9BACT|nr:mobile mystery protein B [Aquirufa ecclesiirivi]MCZ2476008.1 mobile mystery protein B [Aquirufa ecclesiirivi]NHC49792.1 mobile mystery protein B [Aquirufa ecclesiirivi]
MGLRIAYNEGQTPLDDEEKEGLLIPSIATRGELDEFEQQNIEEAIQWALMRTIKAEELLTEEFICKVHERMYANVWKWAGKFRKTNKNLGVDKWQIPSELRILLDDTRFWYENNIYLPDEMAIRFKHRIVSIHCFPNGNGRHSRLMADIIIDKIYQQSEFTWGAYSSKNVPEIRKNYLNAIKAADLGDFKSLLAFARS